MDDLLNEFTNWQLASGMSEATAKRRSLTLCRFFAGRTLGVAPKEIEAWLASLRKRDGRPVTPQTRGMYLSDIRAFYRWAINHDYCTVDPTVKLTNPKRPNYMPDPIQDKPLMAAIAAAPPREKLMLTLAGYAGLRCAEIAGLRLEHVDHDAMTMRVLGKGNKLRLIHMAPEVAELIPKGEHGPAVEWRGKPITPATVSNRLARYLREQGIDATAHKARHSYGTAMYRVSKDLLLTGKQMGHTSPQTTQNYVLASDEDAQAAVRKLYKQRPAAEDAA